MGKTIVIAGDLLAQENLFINEPSTVWRAGARSELDVQEEHEGAWRLADYIRASLGLAENADFIVSAPPVSSTVS